MAEVFFSSLRDLLARPSRYFGTKRERQLKPASAAEIPCPKTMADALDCALSLALGDAPEGGHGPVTYRVRFRKTEDAEYWRLTWDELVAKLRDLLPPESGFYDSPGHRIELQENDQALMLTCVMEGGLREEQDSVYDSADD